MYPSSLRRRAISTFIFEDGIVACSCSALLALRMRVSMSAIGSVSISLPARLGHARDRTLMRELGQADAAQAESLEHGTRTATPVAPGVVAHLELLRTPLLHDERCLRHLLIPPVAVAAERQAHGPEQRTCVVGCLGGRPDRDVETMAP